MMLLVQHGQERSRKGFCLLEMIAAVVIIVILLSAVLANYKIRANKARLEESVSEMMSIAQASLDFYNDQFPQGAWPLSPHDLFPKYMYDDVKVSPFGGNYQINGLNNMVTISTTVPTGLAQNYYQGTLLQILPGLVVDTIAITQEIPNELTGRLTYEKKYEYKQ